MREVRLRCFSHGRRSINTPVGRCERIDLPKSKRGRGGLGRAGMKKLDKI